MACNWERARSLYNWTVDLRLFRHAGEYPGYFNRTVGPREVLAFEDRFRKAVHIRANYQVAGEVCFWKNARNRRIRNRVTQTTLVYLSSGRRVGGPLYVADSHKEQDEHE
jgi:hypothetical protein